MKWVGVKTDGNTVTVLPIGGLGNQLFIFAAGYSLAATHRVDLLVDRSWFGNSSGRTFELDSFAARATIADGAWQKPFHERLPRAIGRMPRVAKGLSSIGAKAHSRRQFTESGSMFDERFLDLNSGISLHGFFQSYRYFETVGHEMREQLFEVMRPSPWYEDKVSQLDHGDAWIALHVRRGDYTDPVHANDFGVLGRSYYKRALDVVYSQVGQLPVRVFSDDVVRAGALLEGICQNYEVVTPPPDSRPIESLLLMARASGIVCANSSYSWWAAWAGDGVDRPVVCPRPWFLRRDMDYRDLLPPDWITVGGDLSPTG